jgi:transposase
MFIKWREVRVFVRPGVTDMRKQANGLTLMVQEAMKLDVLSGNLFVFCSRDRRLLKVVYWDRSGFAVWSKRLAKAKYFWPQTEEQAKEIDVKRLRMLLDGIDFWHAHETLAYAEVG